MNKEINKIISWIETSYTRLNYKEELSLVDYIKQLQQENKQLKEHIEKYEHYCKTTGIEELMKENQKYKEVINEAIKYISSNDIEVLKYNDIPSETTNYEIVTVDLLKILRK